MIADFRIVLWDFDGVIKDSVDVKTRAFVRLFDDCAPEISERVRAHHLANGGMSRYDKMPLYLRWAGQSGSAEKVEEYCRRFSELVFDSVVESPWVPGAAEYLRANPHAQTFALVSATPQAELERIVDSLDLQRCFARVFGAPTSKREAIGTVLRSVAAPPEACLMIGDARADYEAATANGVAFLLRRHALNAGILPGYDGPTVANFSGL